MCHQCKDDRCRVEAVTLVYDGGIVYCKECLEKKRKLQERKRQIDDHKALDDSRKILGDCGEVSIHKCHS